MNVIQNGKKQNDKVMKTCNFCNESLPKEESFYSFQRKNKDNIEYMSKCKTCHKEFRKKYAKRTKYFRKDNSQRCKEYRMRHPNRYREQKRKYIAKRRKNDKNFLVQDRISCQVYQFLKRKNLSKNNSFWKIIDYIKSKPKTE